MTQNRIRLTLLCLMLLVLGLCSGTPAAVAQSTTEGAIAGTVLDPAGAVIAGAAVTLHNDGTNAEIKLVADSNGYFKAPLVPPGSYTVTVTASNFGVFTAKTVPVTVGSLTQVDATLKTGTATESVEVSSEAPVLKTESADISETLTSSEIVNLPLNGGRWSNLALLTPGATADSNGFGLIAFRGISPLMDNVEIDGADDNQAFFSEERGRTREGYSTSQIAIAEFQVNTGVFSAEYGRAAGGVLNAITKSGTNAIHGQAYFQDRDNEWGALGPFTTVTTITPNSGGGAPTIVAGLPFRPVNWRKRWGFGAGGPIVKDKLFWFYAYDQYKRNFPGVAKPATPSSFFNQWADLTMPAVGCATTTTGTGATALVKSTLYTSATATNPIGDTNACALAWRVDSGNYAKAAAQYDQLLFGTAVSSVTGLSGPGLLDEVGTTPRTGDEVLNTPKLDWQVTPTEHASFLFHRLRWDSPGGVQTQTNNNYAKDTFGTDFVKLDYGLAKLDSFITSSISNELRFQYSRELNDEGEQPFTSFTKAYLNNSTGTPVQLFIDGSNASSGTSSTNYGFTAGMPYYSFRIAYPDERKLQIGDTANWTQKNQNFKFGWDYLLNHDVINNLYESNGVYTYTYFSDFFADILDSTHKGTCDASPLQTGLSTGGVSYPCYYGYTQGFGTPVFAIGTQDYGFFVQDDWKILPRLTLNLGLRYDYEHIPPPYPSLIASSELNVAVNGKGPFPDATAAIGNHPSDVNNFGPRVGLSYDVFGNAKTIVHAGFGIYYGRMLNGIVLNAYEATGSPNGQFTIPSIFGQTISAGAPAFPQIINAATSFPTPSIDFFARNFQNPQIHEFDLSVQRELFRNTIVTASYAGALGRELPNFLNLNLNPANMKSVTLTIADATGNSAGTTCGPLACGTAIPTSYYVKPYVNANYGTVTEIVSNINSSYNALIADIQNRGSRYATYDVNYTWSHALDFNQNQSTSPSTNNWWDPNGNARANYGNSTFNVPNRLVAWAMLQYPVNTPGPMKYLLDGWHLNPVFQAQNGLPYTAGVSGTISGAAGSGMIGSGNSGYLLQIGRATYKLPNTYVLDLRVEKDIPIREKIQIELLGEAFNLANHQNVTGVNSTAYTISTAATNSPNTLNFVPPAGAGVNATGFGTVSNADSNFVYSQRQIQLGMKLDF